MGGPPGTGAAGVRGAALFFLFFRFIYLFFLFFFFSLFSFFYEFIGSPHLPRQNPMDLRGDWAGAPPPVPPPPPYSADPWFGSKEGTRTHKKIIFSPELGSAE